MKKLIIPFLLLAALVSAQPSYTGPMPVPPADTRPDTLRRAYHARVDETLDWYLHAIDPAKPLTREQALVKLVRGQDAAAVSQRIIELLSVPQSGDMFWMFPWTAIAFTGRDQLSPEARAAIREAWRTYFPMRGDTENHWVMYYASLFLMTELYPDDPGETWFNGKSSAENHVEAKGFLLHWMDLATTIGQGEFNATHYIGEYAIPMLYLAAWAEDPAMRQRGRMMLDLLMAELADNTLHGVLRGPNARTDDTSVLERWNALATYFSWTMYGHTPPPSGYGGWGIYFAIAAHHYEPPPLFHLIATDREFDREQRDHKRSRRRWRYSDVEMMPVYKTGYIRRDYAVGSYQGGVTDPIQAHVWDVTWREDDPRGVHNTMFSVHPHASARVLQMYFTEYPDWMIDLLASQGKPSYGVPDKILGCSPYEQVFQDLDTVIALYAIPPGENFQRVNGFFSRNLRDVTEDASGWIFARGGNAYLAYRPLAPYTWDELLGYRQLPRGNSGYAWERFRPEGPVDRILVSPHANNGTIVQAASADEFESFEAFQSAMRALPLEFTLEPRPTVKLTTLRGKKVAFTYGETPVVNGQPVDYSRWKLFEGPHLNAGLGSRKITISHGRQHRVLDFNTVTTSDYVTP
ncbi:MAG: hypothetical protein KIT44_09505 [Opitutaceae bacterium]|nr:hypothetical protein [Opitutaceae bacterium]